MKIGDKVYYIHNNKICDGTILDKIKVANSKTIRIYISRGNSSQVARNNEDVYTNIDDAINDCNIKKKLDW